jgi:hypothetical protein
MSSSKCSFNVSLVYLNSAVFPRFSLADPFLRAPLLLSWILESCTFLRLSFRALER